MNRTGSTLRRILLMIAIPLLAFTALAAWSVSSPVASSPDDDFHLASIWCGLGERGGLCEDPDGTTERLIPAPLVSATCYAFQSDESGACWDPDESGMALVKRANTDGLYPPIFYGTMSVFASENIPASVMVMRLLNSAFAVVLLTVVFWALPRTLRPALVVSVIATSVPLGLFVYASTNPSSWALLSAATVWITLYGALRTSARQRWVLTALALFGAVIGAGARADAAVYAVFGVLVAVLLGVRPRLSGSLRAQLVPLVIAALICVISVVFYLNAGQGGAVVTGLASDSPPLTGGQIVSNFLNVPSLWIGALGFWALGWIDTNMPASVWVLSTTVFGGALFVGIRHSDARRVIAIVLTLAALWLVPFVLLVQSRAVIGDLVQPRYLLPLMIIAVGVASLRVDAEQAWRGMRLAIAAGALTFAAAVALHTNIGRYTTGTDKFALDPGTAAEWWWAGAPYPLLVWVAGSLAFGLAIILFSLIPPATVADDATAADHSVDDEGSPARTVEVPGPVREGGPVPVPAASQNAEATS